MASSSAPLSDKMGGLSLESPAAASVSAAATVPPAGAAPDSHAGSAAAGARGKGKAVKTGAVGAGQSSKGAPSSSSPALVAAGSALDATSAPADKKGGEDSRACAGCGAVGGKTLRCSRCLLVFYCSKDCQASFARLRIACRGD